MIALASEAIASSIASYGAPAVAFVVFGYFFGGFVKGICGFALPTVALTFGAMVVSPDSAVAYLAVPTLLMNVWQTWRGGMQAAWDALVEFRLMIGLLLVSLLLATQLLPLLDTRSFAAIMGVGISGFSIAQLFGWKPTVIKRPALDVIAGTVGGFFGGVAGTWGPTVLLTLIAMELEKRKIVQVAGVSFLLGSVPFFIGHAHSGVLNQTTLVISALLVLPVAIGMYFGLKLQDRLDPETFRKVVLWILILAGLNFLRRAFTG